MSKRQQKRLEFQNGSGVISRFMANLKNKNMQGCLSYYRKYHRDDNNTGGATTTKIFVFNYFYVSCDKKFSDAEG